MARLLIPVMLLGAGFALGRLTQSTPPLHAATTTVQQDEQKKRKAFLSGGARSIAVLKEISATLTQTDKRVADMNKRVANIEKLLQKLVEKQAKP